MNNKKVNTENLKKAATEFTEELLRKICEPADRDIKNFDTAQLRFENDYSKRQRGITESVGSTDARRQEIKRKKAELTDQIGAAYSKMDTKTAHELEADLEELSREEYGVQSRIDHMKDIKVSGDLNLFNAMLDAYMTRLKTSADTEADLEELAHIAEEQEIILHNFTKKARECIAAYNPAEAKCPADSPMVQAAEAMVGKLDMTGHMAGSPERAKIRIVRGSSAGIENTPGFKRWEAFRKAAAK